MKTAFRLSLAIFLGLILIVGIASTGIMAKGSLQINILNPSSYDVGPGSTISGYVYDRVSGNPISGATVKAVTGTPGQPPVGAATTVGNGSYTINALPDGSYRVLAFTTGYVQRFWNDTLFSPQATYLVISNTAGAANIDFHLEAGNAITGILTSGSVPLTNVSVAIQSADATKTWGFLVRADGTGIFSLNVPNGTYKVFAPSGLTAAGGGPLGSNDALYIQQYYNNQTSLNNANIVTVSDTNPASSIGINFSLVPANSTAPGGTISGHVYDLATGNPIFGATVVLPSTTPGISIASTTTVSDGSYSFSSLTSGSYRVNARATGHAQRWWSDTLFPPQATYLTINDTVGAANIDFHLEAGSAITGTLTSSSIPLTNVSVAIQSTDATKTWGISVRADGTGIFSLNVPNGTYKVFAPSGLTAAGGGPLGSNDVLYIQQYYNNQTSLNNANIVTVSDTDPSISSGINFSLVAANQVPTVANISPSSGPTVGGTFVTINGTGFVSGNTAVTIGGNAAAGVTFGSTTSITAVTPSGAAGAQNVVVTTPGGSATLPGGFTFVSFPTVASISPSSGPIVGGTAVTINGTGFVSGNTTVTIGGNSATGIIFGSTTSITVITPAGTTGAKNVVVTTPGGSAILSGGFTYVAIPTVTSISPSSGPTVGGTSVTINGTGFVSGNTTVTIGGNAAAGVTFGSTTSITAVTPSGAAGAQNVVVTTPGGSATLPGGFTFVSFPTVASISPSSGPIVGGTAVTINGTGFVSGNTTVTIGGNSATGIIFEVQLQLQ